MLLDKNIGYIIIYVIMYSIENLSIVTYQDIIIIINIGISVTSFESRVFLKTNNFCVLYTFLLTEGEKVC